MEQGVVLPKESVGINLYNQHVKLFLQSNVLCLLELFHRDSVDMDTEKNLQTCLRLRMTL